MAASEPGGWLLVVEPVAAHGVGDGDGKPARSVGSLENLADMDLLRGLRNTGLPVRLGLPPARGTTTDWAPLVAGGPQTMLLVFGKNLDSLAQLEDLCTRLRDQAGRSAGLLACLVPEQAPLPAIMLQAAERLRVAGADDVILGIPAAVELLDRARAVVRVRRRLGKSEQAQLQLQTLVSALSLLGPMGGDLGGAERNPNPSGPREENAPEPVAAETSADPGESARVFQQFTVEVRTAVGCAHVALVLLGDDTDGLTVVTASSEPHDTCFPGPRFAYPELRGVLQRGSLGEITEDKERLALTRAVSPGPALVPWVVPLPLTRGAVSGGSGWALVLYESRMPGQQPAGSRVPAARELLASFAQLLALAVRSRHLDESLRERTRRVRISHLSPTPPQKRPLLQYREFFEASADGVMVLDASARLVWLNRAAEQMTGYATAGLAGHLLCEVVPASYRDTVFRTVEQVLAGGPVKIFDLALTSTSSETLVLSVSTSPLLAEERYVVLSFRDVTEKRVLETELRTTKEFLERLIDSTVDGIIAADVEGKVVLFNQGAARITGYTPDEVIGKLPVWALYPDKEAQRVMAQLRSEGLGGRGRLLQSRRTILGKNNVLVPVALTASIIYEGDREVATVGVLSDLRERLRIEQRLMQTEEKRERQALIVELAGTAAHELNQPLTSVMGYAELVRRRIPDGYSDIHEFADILVREAERMADIVRKIGRITRYETKTYVGESRILDLDKSARPDSFPEFAELPSLLPSESSPEVPADESLPLFSGVVTPPKPTR